MSKTFFTTTHALRIVGRAKRTLEWTDAEVAKFLDISTEAIRLWRTGRTTRVSRKVTARLRELHDYNRRAAR